MATENVNEFGAAEAGEEPLREHLDGKAEGWRLAGPDDVPALFGDLLPDGAGQKMKQEEKELSLETMRDVFATGFWGWLDDDMACVSDWGFDLTSIEVPVSIWHAEQDAFIPPPHGMWLADNVPGAALCLCPGEHMWVSKEAFGEMLDRLLEEADPASKL
jgi:pimeloyl-ACP methyl ester carboxylesterase